VIIKLQKSPLIIAEMRRSPEIPAIRMVVSVFSKKPITTDPGGRLGKILAFLVVFGLNGFSVYEVRIII
jgi:hypothetical protein